MVIKITNQKLFWIKTSKKSICKIILKYFNNISKLDVFHLFSVEKLREAYE